MEQARRALAVLFVALTLVGVASAGSLQLIRAESQANSVCKSFKLCHNSKGLAWTSISVFQGLEPLFDELKLSPMNDYVQINELPQRGLKDGCACSTPVEVLLTLPIAPGGATDVLLSVVDRFVQQRLAPLVKDVVCMLPMETVQCKTAETYVAQRRRLSEDAPIDNNDDDTTTTEDDTTTTTAVDSSDLSDADEVAPVPDINSLIFESSASGSSGSTAGGYYGQPEAGGYYPTPELGGYYGRPEAGGYYGSSSSANRPTGRRLNSDFGEYEHEHEHEHKQHTKPAVHFDKHSKAASTCPPCPACGEASFIRAAQLNARTSATCYCRYSSATASWSLDDAACRSALYARCGPAGSLLECAQLQAFYASEAPAAAAAITSFLFVDCPPAAPCSCGNAMFDGRSPATQQCCADLRAHCQVPFGGLSCRAVDAVCAGMPSADVKAFVRVKVHGAVCAAPGSKAFSSYTMSAVNAAVHRVVDPLAAAAGKQAPTPLGAGLLGVMVGAGMAAVGLAVTGIVALVQHFARHQGQAAPLLSDY